MIKSATGLISYIVGLVSSKAETKGKPLPSIITADLVIEGSLSSNGPIQIDGKVRGDIMCSRLIIGHSGGAVGEVTAETVCVHGKLSGNIRATSVFLDSTAHMIGDIEYETLGIEPEAFMHGHCTPVVEQQTVASSPHLVTLEKSLNGSDEEHTTASPIDGTD